MEYKSSRPVPTNIKHGVQVKQTCIQIKYNKNLPIEEANTSPRPTARGPPMFRNFSLGAHIATVDNPVKIDRKLLCKTDVLLNNSSLMFHMLNLK
jgi:hypothetical protein